MLALDGQIATATVRGLTGSSVRLLPSVQIPICMAPSVELIIHLPPLDLPIRPFDASRCV